MVALKFNIWLLKNETDCLLIFVIRWCLVGLVGYLVAGTIFANSSLANAILALHVLALLLFLLVNLAILVGRFLERRRVRLGVALSIIHTVHFHWHITESIGHVSLHVLKSMLHLSHSLVHVSETILHMSLLVGEVSLKSRIHILNSNSGALALWCIGILSHLLAISILADHSLAFAILAYLLLSSL